MPGAGLVKRYSLLLIGLFFMGLGISLVTRSALGTSPISSVPWVLCLALPITFGEFTMAFNMLFFAAEVLIIGKAFPKHQYLQIVVGLSLGVFVDLGMMLSAGVHPDFYAEEIAVLIFGCVVLALGIFLQVAANVIMNPGEGLVKAIAIKTGKRFGIVKVCFDSTLVLSAVCISLVAFGSIRGLREGTVISAILVGYIILGFGIIFTRFDLGKWLEN
ncbi:YitT family protein [Methanoregula sp.]|uniref:YczE/YyaS/YitT family protein n=1 Tax=Methanoregula sp. TaxID=2052170 RepID=UPI0035641529